MLFTPVQFPNVYAPTLFTFFPALTEVKPLQSLNAELSRTVTLSGMFSSPVNPLHPLNAELPIFVIPSGIDSSPVNPHPLNVHPLIFVIPFAMCSSPVNPLHPLNAAYPTDVTLSGIYKFPVSLLQPLNAYSPISSNPSIFPSSFSSSGNFNSQFRFVHPKKAESPIFFSESGNVTLSISVLFLNTSIPISVTPSGITTFLSVPE